MSINYLTDSRNIFPGQAMPSGGALARRMSRHAESANAGNATDVFARTRPFAGVKTYGAMSKTVSQSSSPSSALEQTTQTSDIATSEGRREIAKNYDAILKSLREQYGEEEAMLLFDEIMRADGFELVKIGEATEAALTKEPTNTVSGFAVGIINLYGDIDADLCAQMGQQYNTDSSLHLQSKLYTIRMNGNIETVAASYAIYGATRPLSGELQDYWQNRYLDSARSGADFDVDKYMGALSNPEQRSVVAVDEQLGALVTSILNDNGIALESGQSIEFEWGSGGVVARTSSGDNYNDIFNGNAEFLEMAKALADNPPPEDVGKLSGQFAAGDRSVEYTFNRFFNYSADEPSAVVVNDFLGVVGTGYTYVKKVGDYFDAESESKVVGEQTNATDIYEYDDNEDYFRDKKTSANMLNSILRNAYDADGRVEATVSIEEMNKYKLDAATEFQKKRTDAVWYNLHTGEIEDMGADHAGNRNADADNGGALAMDEPKNVKDAVSKIEASRARGGNRTETVRQIIESLNARQSALFDRSM